MNSDVMFRHNVHIRGGVRASVLSYQRPPKHLICQFLYNIGDEMHFYQENREKNLLKHHHSLQDHQSKGCTAQNINSCIPCFTILILRNKLDLVHVKSHVKYKSDIKRPKCGYIKASGGWGLCKKALRNTLHVSDKAYRNCQIRLLSEVSVIIRTFTKTQKVLIRVLKNCKKDQKFIFSNYQNLSEIKEK